jgi:hypothetical protein
MILALRHERRLNGFGLNLDIPDARVHHLATYLAKEAILLRASLCIPARKIDMEQRQRRLALGGEGLGDTERKAGVGSTTERNHDALELALSAVAEDGTVARRIGDEPFQGAAVGPPPCWMPIEQQDVGIMVGNGIPDALFE